MSDPLEKDLDAAEQILNPYYNSLKLLEISRAYLDRGDLEKASCLTKFTLKVILSITNSESSAHIFEEARKVFTKIKAAKDDKALLVKV